MVTFQQEEYPDEPNVIRHYGTKRHSGRYPYGSGDDETGGATQRQSTLLNEIARSQRELNISDVEAAKLHGVNSTQLRDMRTVVRNERKQEEIHVARKLKATDMSNVAIAREMKRLGYKVSGEAQVRNLLKDSQERKAKILDTVTDTLRDAVDKKGFIDVGSGVEFQLDVSDVKLRAALSKLKDEGYKVYSDIKIDQLTTGQKTTLRVLTGKDKTWGDVFKNRDKIQQIEEYSDDGGYTRLGMLPPKSFDSKRLGIVYKEQGGTDADGVMYVRRGVSDVAMGKNRYAQVRVMVDGSHYIKGMAIVVDDDQMPPGKDILFHTNKSDTGNKLDALKPAKRVKAPGDVGDKHTGPIDQDNPFGASIKRQIGNRDPHDGKLKDLTSVMNLVNEEGDWDKWSKTLSSQMLSKQPPSLAKEQLNQALTRKKNELDEIMRLTNPSVRKKLLESFADSADSAAVHLKAAALGGQKTQVLLPIKDLNPREVYAPNFPNGTHVVLVRFPHGGTFEIPELMVNNRAPAGKKLLPADIKDAIGIHPSVAERLSGADFDGDSVLVIPNNSGKVRTSPALEGLKNFDPKTQYAHYEGMKVMTKYETGLEMGGVSNLITDMTIGKATSDELARAVRHSMVVIDAEKHKLDYKRSEIDNGIAALKKKYQGGKANSGASTLISRATSRLDVNERTLRRASEGGPIDPKTGKLVYVETGTFRKYTNAKGKEVVKVNKERSVKLAETDDAHTLSSGTVIEKHYGDYSNEQKALANKARLELLKIKPLPYSPSAKKIHAPQVETLNAKLRVALENAPRERQAQVLANAVVRLKVQEHPELRLRDNTAELRRVESQALAAARLRTNAEKAKMTITKEEWDAIQAGAITHSKLDAILQRADLDVVKELATPRDRPVMSASNKAKATALHNKGYTWAEVAEALGVSVSSVKDALNPEGGDED